MLHLGRPRVLHRIIHSLARHHQNIVLHRGVEQAPACPTPQSAPEHARRVLACCAIWSSSGPISGSAAPLCRRFHTARRASSTVARTWVRAQSSSSRFDARFLRADGHRFQQRRDAGAALDHGIVHFARHPVALFQHGAEARMHLPAAGCDRRQNTAASTNPGASRQEPGRAIEVRAAIRSRATLR